MTATLTRKAQAKLEAEEAAAELRELFPIGSTMTTLLRHVSSSGMYRSISVVKDDRDVSYLIAKLPGYKRSKRYNGIDMGGCGMDMGFSLVYGVSRYIYRDAFYCIGAGDDARHGRCHSNDHSNYRGERGQDDYSPTRLHSDAGYAISQRWL